MALHSGKADPLLTFKHVERSFKVGATLTPFIHEVRAARFLHLDRFALLAAGSKLHLYRYWLPDETEKNDIKRLAAEGKYKLAVGPDKQFLPTPSTLLQTLNFWIPRLHPTVASHDVVGIVCQVFVGS